MTITRADVADLRPGDVVEYSGHKDLHGAKITGPLYQTSTGSLCVGDYVVRHGNGSPAAPGRIMGEPSLTVVFRAPRLYVNSDRAEPVPGDLVRDVSGLVLFRTTALGWISSSGDEYDPRRGDGLRLLVDGETGQVVP